MGKETPASLLQPDSAIGLYLRIDVIFAGWTDTLHDAVTVGHTTMNIAFAGFCSLENSKRNTNNDEAKSTHHSVKRSASVNNTLAQQGLYS